MPLALSRSPSVTDWDVEFPKSRFSMVVNVCANTMKVPQQVRRESEKGEREGRERREREKGEREGREREGRERRERDSDVFTNPECSEHLICDSNAVHPHVPRLTVHVLHLPHSLHTVRETRQQ